MTRVMDALVIDDSAYNRRTLSRLLEETGFVRVVATASDGEEGLRRALALRPDLVTLDLEMPRMDGFTFLRILMAQRPTPVIVISGQANDQNVFRALDCGAVDFLAKPTRYISDRLLDIREELLAKVRAVRELHLENLMKRAVRPGAPARPRPVPAPLPPLAPGAAEAAEPAAVPEPAPASVRLVVVGASTGGPNAIQTILVGLGPRFPAPIVVAQHMPPGFTRTFAERLDRLSGLGVREGADGDRLEPGLVLIAPGGFNTRVVREGGDLVVRTEPQAPRQTYVPSVDVLFESAAAAVGPGLLGVLLTGMGNDGRRGMLRIKAAGGRTVAESEETAIVFGMPREAIAAGAVDRVLPLPAVASELLRRVGAERSGAEIA